MLLLEVPSLTWSEELLRVVVAAGLGGAVGLERELREREAGFRTHLLVSVGSCLFTIVSAYGFHEFLVGGGNVVRADPTRIAAQRVPPSAWSTSQSSQSVRSPSASRSATDRSARPISRWISTVRPFWRPVLASRCVRSPVDAGSSEYSAVSQPRPEPLSQRGVRSSSEAVQSTRVLPCA